MHVLARTPKQIGATIRRNRKLLGISQTALADLVGLRQETISLIETGNSATRIDTLLALLATLDLEFRIAARSHGSDPSDLVE